MMSSLRSVGLSNGTTLYSWNRMYTQCRHMGRNLSPSWLADADNGIPEGTNKYHTFCIYRDIDADNGIPEGTNKIIFSIGSIIRC